MHLSPIPNLHLHAGHLTANIKKNEYPTMAIAKASKPQSRIPQFRPIEVTALEDGGR
jgi:hypothetical protein